MICLLTKTGVVGVRAYQRHVFHGGRVLRVILPHKFDACRRGLELRGRS